MKLKSASLSLIAILSLSGCHSMSAYSEVPVPREDIGGPRADSGWSPYTPSVPQPRADDRWQSRDPGVGVVRETPVSRQALPEIAPVPSAGDGADDTREPVPAEGFTRAQPKDPPLDPARRRVYSSRPDRSASPSADDSAFGSAGRATTTENTSRARRGISSEWADKTVRTDNRPAFDRMVSDSARLGNGSFEDEAGRIYFGERRRREGGCTVVEVTVTTNGGLPVVSRGLAYDCR
jgi:hypothetical protein